MNNTETILSSGDAEQRDVAESLSYPWPQPLPPWSRRNPKNQQGQQQRTPR